MHNLKNAKYIKDYIVELEFDNNEIGQIDFSYLTQKNGVFEKFKDIDFFKSFFVNKDSETLEWPGEIDLCPDTLYSQAIVEKK